MKPKYSTREAAKKLGRTLLMLQQHISAGTIKAPPSCRHCEGWAVVGSRHCVSGTRRSDLANI